MGGGRAFNAGWTATGPGPGAGHRCSQGVHSHDAVAFLASLELFQVAVEAAGGLACQLVKAGPLPLVPWHCQGGQWRPTDGPLGTADAVVVLGVGADRREGPAPPGISPGCRPPGVVSRGGPLGVQGGAARRGSGGMRLAPAKRVVIGKCLRLKGPHSATPTGDLHHRVT